VSSRIALLFYPEMTIGHSCDHEQDCEGSKAIAVAVPHREVDFSPLADIISSR
jgi:hypothetical protein